MKTVLNKLAGSAILFFHLLPLGVLFTLPFIGIPVVFMALVAFRDMLNIEIAGYFWIVAFSTVFWGAVFYKFIPSWTHLLGLYAWRVIRIANDQLGNDELLRSLAQEYAIEKWMKRAGLET
ncbi:MAG: hypothetical protein WC654_02415 [Patescibacteria group bacterium]